MLKRTSTTYGSITLEHCIRISSMFKKIIFNDEDMCVLKLVEINVSLQTAR